MVRHLAHRTWLLCLLATLLGCSATPAPSDAPSAQADIDALRAELALGTFPQNTARTIVQPTPLVPADNPSNPARLALGERLFHETALSVTGAFSCASCHQPDRHFTDARRVAVGATGQAHTRNTPTLYNTAYHASFGWDDQGVETLEAQHRIPLINTTPVELGYTPKNAARLAQDPAYRRAFTAAFGNARIDLDTITKAIATWVRTLRAPLTGFDRYVYFDDASAMSAEARAGMDLFFSTRLGCATCHASFSLSGPVRHSEAPHTESVFHVTEVGGSQTAFRAPTLRSVRHTAPYMHDGSLETLEDVIRHYETTPAERVPRFNLTDAERAQLAAFLRSL